MVKNKANSPVKGNKQASAEKPKRATRGVANDGLAPPEKVSRRLWLKAKSTSKRRNKVDGVCITPVRYKKKPINICTISEKERLYPDITSS